MSKRALRTLKLTYSLVRRVGAQTAVAKSFALTATRRGQGRTGVSSRAGREAA